MSKPVQKAVARKKYKLNWSPDIPDFRDQSFQPLQTYMAARPPVVDLRKYCSPVEDQGHVGSCTAQAIAGALEYLMGKQPSTTGKDFWNISRLFIYYEERVVLGTPHIDSGAYIRDGIKVCARVGFPGEIKWPHILSRWKMKPSVAAYEDAKLHKIQQYFRCTNFAQVLNALAQGLPVIFGFAVYDSFVTDEVAKTGTGVMPKPQENMLGGHAVLAVGYNDAKREVLIRNSWGVNWGQKGYFTLPYDYVNNQGLAADFWVIRA